jgi:hypothetical protein
MNKPRRIAEIPARSWTKRVVGCCVVTAFPLQVSHIPGISPRRAVLPAWAGSFELRPFGAFEVLFADQPRV